MSQHLWGTMSAYMLPTNVEPCTMAFRDIVLSKSPDLYRQDVDGAISVAVSIDGTWKEGVITLKLEFYWPFL